MRWISRFLWKLKIVLLLCFALTFVWMPVYADEASDSFVIKRESINPGSFYYPVKRIWEKIRERVNFSSDSKIRYHRFLVEVRLSELEYIVDKNLLSEVQTSSERFSYQVGVLADDLKRFNNNQKEKELGDFKEYSKVLEKLRDKYPANSSFWMLIQHDINTLQILSETLR